jgi:hypothetical protein
LYLLKPYAAAEVNLFLMLFQITSPFSRVLETLASYAVITLSYLTGKWLCIALFARPKHEVYRFSCCGVKNGTQTEYSGII